MALLTGMGWAGLLWGLPLGFLIGAMAVGVSAHGRLRAMTKNCEAMEELIFASHSLISERCDTAMIEEATALMERYLRNSKARI